MNRPRVSVAWCALLALFTVVGCASAPARSDTATAVPSGACAADGLGPLERAGDLGNPACGSGPACGDACAGGDAIACYVRANELQQETGQSTAPNAMYLSACRAGLAIGCTNYAASLWAGRDAAAAVCAKRLFERTCAADEEWGCGMLGRMIIDAASPEADAAGAPPKRTPAQLEQLRRGREVLERSCEKLGRFPCRALALELESGSLGPPDAATTRKLLERACATGDGDACGRPSTAGSTFHKLP